jgi:hypothetical protein
MTVIMPHLGRDFSRLTLTLRSRTHSSSSTNQSEIMAAANRRGVVFSMRERLHLLDIIADELPVSSAAWEHVADIHREMYDAENRTADSLKRKFNELTRRPAPTGDPNVPEDVRLAKQIRQMIVRSVNASTGENEEEDEFASVADGMEFEEPFEMQEVGVPALQPVEVFPNGIVPVGGPGMAAAMAIAADAAVDAAAANGGGGPPPAVAVVARNGGGPPAAAAGGPPAVSRTFANNVNNLRAARGGRTAGGRGTGTAANGTSGTGSFSFENIMSMMMMQQQMDREERRNDAELRREEIKAQAMRDEIRREELQADIRAQNERHSSFMQIIAMSMIGGNNNKKRKREAGSERDEEDVSVSDD